MSFGRPSWIATHLLGEEAASQVVVTTVEEVAFGNTAGPWGGIGGSAISMFTMTLFDLADGALIVFADEKLLGWAPMEGREAAREAFPRYNLASSPVLLTSECPYLSEDGEASVDSGE